MYDMGSPSNDGALGDFITIPSKLGENICVVKLSIYIVGICRRRGSFLSLRFSA